MFAMETRLKSVSHMLWCTTLYKSLTLITEDFLNLSHWEHFCVCPWGKSSNSVKMFQEQREACVIALHGPHPHPYFIHFDRDECLQGSYCGLFNFLFGSLDLILFMLHWFIANPSKASCWVIIHVWVEPHSKHWKLPISLDSGAG